MTYLENRELITSITVGQAREYLAARGAVSVNLSALESALESARSAALADVWSTPERVLQSVARGMSK